MVRGIDGLSFINEVDHFGPAFWDNYPNLDIKIQMLQCSAGRDPAWCAWLREETRALPQSIVDLRIFFFTPITRALIAALVGQNPAFNELRAMHAAMMFTRVRRLAAAGHNHFRNHMPAGWEDEARLLALSPPKALASRLATAKPSSIVPLNFTSCRLRPCTTSRRCRAPWRILFGNKPQALAPRPHRRPR